MLAAAVLQHAAPAGAEPVASHSPLFCTSPQLVSQDYVDAMIRGEAPAATVPGGRVAVTGARLQLIVSVQSSNVIRNLLRADRVQGAVTRFDVVAGGATPARFDLAAAGPLAFGPAPVEVGGPLILDVPLPGGIIGPVTAGAVGSATLQAGHVEIAATLTSSTDPNLRHDITLSCDLAFPLAIASVPVRAPRPAGQTGGTVTAQSGRGLRKLAMQVTGVSGRCSAARSRKVRVRVRGARGGVRVLVFRLDGRLVRTLDMSGRLVTLRLRDGKRRQRLTIRATDEAGRSITFRRTLCLRA